MDYIINPMWFYWFNVINNLAGLLIAIALITGAAFITLIIIFCTAYDEDAKTIKKWIKRSFIVCLITTVIALLIPNKETLISMMIAKFATKTNAQLSLDAVKSAVDYILAGIKQLK